MLGKTTFAPGMTVVCVDNEQAPFLIRDAFYTVQAVTHQGALVTVNGTDGMYAAVRFAFAGSMNSPKSMEYCRAQTRN